MKINSSRFGELEIKETDVIEFPEGLLGFESEKSFCLIDGNDNTYLLWLQSTNNPNICFPVLEPEFFIQDFDPNLLPADLRRLNIDSQNEVSFYSIITIPNNIKELSANIKAPVALNIKTKVARQVVLQDNKLDVSYPIYTEFRRTLNQIKQYNQSHNSNPEIVSNRFSNIQL